MSTLTTNIRRVIATLSVLIAASLAWTGCSHEKEYVDEQGPTTGEVEVSKHETEYEVEKDLPEDESRATGEKEYETKHGEVEVTVEDDEVEIEGEREYPGGDNPDYAANSTQKNSTEKQEQSKLPEPQPEKAVVVTEVYRAPTDFIGTTVVAEADVKDVISDRGFWLNHNGERIFAVVREDIPREEMIDINQGQHLEFGGILVDGSDWKHLTGDLEQETKKTLEEQPYFIAVYWDHIEITNTSSNGQAAK